MGVRPFWEFFETCQVALWHKVQDETVGNLGGRKKSAQILPLCAAKNYVDIISCITLNIENLRLLVSKTYKM